MRALIVSHLYAEPVSRGKLRAIAGQGVELGLAVPNGTQGLDGGIRISPVAARGSPARLEDLAWSSGALRRLLSDFRPDLIHLEVPPHSQAAAAAAAQARRLKLPYVAFSADGLPRMRGVLARYRYRGTTGGAAGIIGGNQPAADLLAEAAPQAKKLVIPQFGVAPAPPVHTGALRPGLRLGFIGRLVPERGGEVLLRAAAGLLGAWSLTIVGTGPEQESLEELAQRLGLASRIRWLGGVPKSELGPVWEEIDCLVVPSRSTSTWMEGANPVLLEAMARGIAPVVTQSGALPEIVGPAGVIIDDPETLSERLQELLADPARVRALGERARQRILEEFTDAAIAQRTIGFWKEVLAPR